ncbi:Pkinase-domain-containing protein [Pleurotus eryngii]|uniref:non-specific serine/threonine protein kinase n=1 Tax=Pleurotus eryngii TaxID=5323 RepID=A0A9P6AA79_PLEER|nr:Pkinase-domain-containing protein [Pleurotus eryngii]
MFYELCKAVAWMHSVGLVHRDIKLENILLATSAFSSTNPASPPTLASLPLPLILLTDFGLSRFIDPSNPLLTTRCGSEAYAAPELAMGGGRGSVASKSLRFKISGYNSSVHEAHEYDGENEGGYDARETDAWACGVVLFALVCRRLPFGEGATGIRGEREEGNEVADRRRWLMKIAKGDYSWPEHNEQIRVVTNDHEERELRGMDLVRSEGAKRVVGRLLVRDPSKRLSIGELMRVEEEWVSPVDRGGDEDMGGDETISTFDSAEGPYAGGHVVALPARGAKPDTPLTFGVELPDDQDQDGQDADGEDEEDGGQDEDDGWLITEPPRDSIVCREVV